VCGKGLEAALIAAGLHTTVHVLVHEGLGVAALVRSLNRYLCATLPAGVFVTMCSLVIDPETGEIEQVNCGHPPPMIATPGGALREVETFEQAPLGFLDGDGEIVVTRDRLDHGQLLALYTDGLSELLDERDHMLEVEGLAALVAAVAVDGRASSATQLATRLRARLAAYRGAAVPADDASFILVLRPSVSSPSPTLSASRSPS
jgi:serine phosphatase RsbU (regulator of sigma subunit)